MIQKLKCLFFLLVFIVFSEANGQVFEESDQCDLIVFSYNRPMQLFALLESLEQLATNIHRIAIVCRMDSYYEEGYKIVKEQFPGVHFFQQSNINPKEDFKPIVMELVFGTFGADANYVMFAVDDIIITDELDVREGIHKLQTTGAYGLYYRLGKHVDFCWIQNFHQGVPPLRDVGDDYFAWQFKTGRGDWNYPNTVDLTLYRKADIQNELSVINFTYPNDMEGYWATLGNNTRIGLCYKRAKIINIPANIVSDTKNRSTHSHSAQHLNELFLSGLKIDISQFYHIINNSPHCDYIPQFINR